MGIHLGLRYRPDGIEASAWARAYDESVALLRAWPRGLLRLEQRPFGGRKVLAYSKEIEEGQGDDRSWKVEGDAASLRSAETFQLSRRRRRSTSVDVEGEILVELLREQAATAFYAKTQGEPHHVAILAVALLFEHRFPGAAIATGDLDAKRGEEAAAFAEAVIGEPVAPPILLDRERIAARLEGKLTPDEIEAAVDDLWMRPFGNVGLAADLIGLLRATSARHRARLDEDSLTELRIQGDASALTTEQRLALASLVVGAKRTFRTLKDHPEQDRLRWTDREWLAEMSMQHSVALTEDAWSRLDALEEGPALTFAVALAAKGGREMTTPAAARHLREPCHLRDVRKALRAARCRPRSGDRRGGQRPVQPSLKGSTPTT